MKIKLLIFSLLAGYSMSTFASNNEVATSNETSSTNAISYNQFSSTSSFLKARRSSGSESDNKPGNFRFSISLPLSDKHHGVAGFGGGIEIGKQWYMLNLPVQFGPYATWLDLGAGSNKHTKGFQSQLGQRIGLAVRYKLGNDMTVDSYFQYHYGIAPRYAKDGDNEAYVLDGLSGRTFGANFRISTFYIGVSFDYVTHHFMTGTNRNISYSNSWYDMAGKTSYGKSIYDNMFRVNVGFIWD